MRKDLKIGLAIGAVLLVVMIVYVASPRNNNTELAGGSNDATGVTEPDASAGGDADAQPADTSPPDSSTADDGDAGALQPAPPAVAGGNNTGRASDPFEPDAEGDDPADESAGGEVASGGGETNWGKILDTGRAEPERTETPSPSDRTAAANRDLIGLSASRVVPPAAGGGNDSSAVGGANSAPLAGAGSATVGDRSSTEIETSPPTGPDINANTNTGTATAGNTSDAARIPPGPQTEAGRTHVMQKGETFTSIAKMLYGDGRHYLAIQKANPDLDDRRIRAGTVIKLPDAATVKADAATAAAPDAGSAAATGAATAEVKPLDPKTEYEVKANDSLHRIATRVYGTSTMWEKIYELNRQAIGDDPAKLKLGMVLKLPPSPGGDISVDGDAADASTESASR